MLINAYLERSALTLVHADGTTTSAPLSFDYFVESGSGYQRIQHRTYAARKLALESERRPHFEGDLSPVRRFLADNPDIEIARPRRVFVDIETDPRPGFANKPAMRILCIAAVAEDTGDVRNFVLSEDTDDAERSMLFDFWQHCGAFQIITAYNGGDSWSDRKGFDFPVLRARSFRYWPELRYRMQRWLFEDQLAAYKRLYLMFAESGEERSSFSLDAVCRSVLGVGKTDFDSKQCYTEWAAGGSRRDRLVEYNTVDTVRLRELEQATHVLDLAFRVCQTCGALPGTEGLHPTTFVDSFLLRLGTRRGQHFPTKFWREDSKKNYAGGYVREPKFSGIMQDVFVLDANSLYPSSIRQLNASPETIGKPGCVAPITGITFATEPEGILPEACRMMMVEKSRLKNEYKSLPPGSKERIEKQATHDAWKSILNSAYGVVGSVHSRWYDKDLAESITQMGAFCMKAVGRETERRGYTCLFGDTDSLAVTGCTREAFVALVEHCNAVLLPGIAANHRCAENMLRLEFDKHYETFVGGVKDDGTPARKKYFGRPAGSATYETKGFEMRRGDGTPLARSLQRTVADLLMLEHRTDPEDFVLPIISARDHVLHDSLPLDEIVISESVREELDSYEIEGPAVRVGKMLRDRGEDVSPGTKVRYVITDASVSPAEVIPASDFAGEYDRYYVWASVFAPTRRVLMGAFPGYDWKKFENVRPPKLRVSGEQKYQAKLEARGQLRIPGT